MAAFMALAMFPACLRPSEAGNLLERDLAPPSASPRFFAMNFHPGERGKAGEVRLSEESIMLDSIVAERLGEALQAARGGTPPQPLFASCDAGGPLTIARVASGLCQRCRGEAGAGIEVAFQPSTANAECLAAELPDSMGPKVLYAASAIAADTLQEGLGARGLQVERLDTYTTRPVASPSAELLAQMASTDVVTFGSPSAVRAVGSFGAPRAVERGKQRGAHGFPWGLQG
ncbi:unnamed protein product [Prorocentrum cordatum]|uniref:Uroporphyrinogen-III synthase n=1 Tax=Prorocentrum cordatum TaxID=2364126 RepID=A0ABN9PRZ2_9DINO|nr:unnamed protein product [Polarella glacialis]